MPASELREAAVGERQAEHDRLAAGADQVALNMLSTNVVSANAARPSGPGSAIGVGTNVRSCAATASRPPARVLPREARAIGRRGFHGTRSFCGAAQAPGCSCAPHPSRCPRVSRRARRAKPGRCPREDARRRRGACASCAPTSPGWARARRPAWSAWRARRRPPPPRAAAAARARAARAARGSPAGSARAAPRRCPTPAASRAASGRASSTPTIASQNAVTMNETRRQRAEDQQHADDRAEDADEAREQADAHGGERESTTAAARARLPSRPASVPATSTRAVVETSWAAFVPWSGARGEVERVDHQAPMRTRPPMAASAGPKTPGSGSGRAARGRRGPASCAAGSSTSRARGRPAPAGRSPSISAGGVVVQVQDLRRCRPGRPSGSPAASRSASISLTCGPSASASVWTRLETTVRQRRGQRREAAARRAAALAARDLLGRHDELAAGLSRGHRSASAAWARPRRPGGRSSGSLAVDDARQAVAGGEHEVEQRRGEPDAGLDAAAPGQLGGRELRHGSGSYRRRSSGDGCGRGRGRGPGAPAPAALLQALARLAHQRDRLGEDDRHHGADLLGLLARSCPGC